MGGIVIDDEEIKRIYYIEYLNGDSTIVIGKRYNINPSTIGAAFRRLNLKLRSNKENSRKYSCNEYIFNDIDTPEKAYWIGFLSADGYVSSSGNYIGLSLSAKDREQVQKFKDFVSANYPVHEYKSTGYTNSNYCRICIKSEIMHSDLIRHGVVCQKTYYLKKPETIKRGLLKYYILGYFDGDGSIYVNHSKYPFYSISIVATEDLCNFINTFLLEEGIICKKSKVSKRKIEQPVSYIRFGGNKIVSRIMSYLYSGINLDVPLKRKYDLYLKCANRQF